MATKRRALSAIYEEVRGLSPYHFRLYWAPLSQPVQTADGPMPLYLYAQGQNGPTVAFYHERLEAAASPETLMRAARRYIVALWLQDFPRWAEQQFPRIGAAHAIRGDEEVGAPGPAVGAGLGG